MMAGCEAVIRYVRENILFSQPGNTIQPLILCWICSNLLFMLNVHCEVEASARGKSLRSTQEQRKKDESGTTCLAHVLRGE